MSWRNDPEFRERKRYAVPDYGGDTRAPGDAGHRGSAKDYKNEPMTRDEAERIQIAVGLMLEGYPVERRAVGEGFSLLIPAEFFRNKHPGVKSILARGVRR